METTQLLLPSDAGRSLGKSAAPQLSASAVGISLGVHTPTALLPASATRQKNQLPSCFFIQNCIYPLAHGVHVL